MILAYHHVQVNVPTGKETAARKFYCGVLGLVEIETPEDIIARGGFWLQLGDLQLHIGSEDGVDPHKTKSHIAYQVTDVSYWRAKLAALGMQTSDGIPVPGIADRIDFRDPFGNKIEFMQVV